MNLAQARSVEASRAWNAAVFLVARQRSRAGERNPPPHGNGAGGRDYGRGRARPSGCSESPQRATKEWTGVLAAWAERELHNSDAPLLETALPEFEKTLIETAMSQTKGHRQEAAKLLGWGRKPYLQPGHAYETPL